MPHPHLHSQKYSNVCFACGLQKVKILEKSGKHPWENSFSKKLQIPSLQLCKKTPI